MQHLAVSLLALASTSLAQYTSQSKPFQLVIQSDDGNYDAANLGACHEGAAIEGLCVGGGSTFYHNTSENALVQNESAGEQGVLTYILRGGNFNSEFDATVKENLNHRADALKASEPMKLHYYESSNVALPLFEPLDEHTLVAFDKDNKMNIQAYIDDTVTPPTAGNFRPLYRWYVCQTYYAGYTYTTLAWVMGNAEPQNPSCKSVQVVREFI